MFLLDSSAWLAHLFAEPGVEQVNELFDDADNAVFISVLSLPELYGRLKALDQQAKWDEVWQAYAGIFTGILPVNEAAAHQAILIREQTVERLPTIDGLIAGIEVVHHLTLVHRDPHFTAISDSLLPQMVLL